MWVMLPENSAPYGLRPMYYIFWIGTIPEVHRHSFALTAGLRKEVILLRKFRLDNRKSLYFSQVQKQTRAEKMKHNTSNSYLLEYSRRHL